MYLSYYGFFVVITYEHDMCTKTRRNYLGLTFFGRLLVILWHGQLSSKIMIGISTFFMLMNAQLLGKYLERFVAT